jgi:hypothetical protein
MLPGGYSGRRETPSPARLVAGLPCRGMSREALQQAVQVGAGGFTRRVRITCGDGLMADQLGARELSAHVVVDPALPPTEVLVTAERVGS